MTDVYVATDGEDDNATNIDGSGYDRGSIQYPYATLDFADNNNAPSVTLASGDTIYIRAGTYVGGVTMSITKEGTEGDQTTVKAYDDEEVIFSSSIRAYSDYWAFEDLIFDRGGLTGSCGIVIGQASDGSSTIAIGVTVDNCTFRNHSGTNAEAFAIDAGTDLTVTNCLFDNVRARVDGADARCVAVGAHAINVTFSNCTFIDCSGDCFLFSEVEADWSNKILTNFIVENCHGYITNPYVYRDEYGNVATTPTVGVEGWDGSYCGENFLDIKYGPTDGSVGIIIRNNLIENYRATATNQDASGSNGVAITCHNDAAGTYIYNNIIRNCTSGISWNGPTADRPNYPYVSAYTKIYSNLIITDDSPSPSLTLNSPAAVTGISVSRFVDIDVYNNTVDYGTNAAQVLGTSYTTATAVIANNIFKSVGGTISGDTDVSGTFSNNLYYSVASIPVDVVGTNDLEVDPLLDSDYKPTKDSPCREAGTYVGVRDYNGRPYHVPPTIGAYEFTSGFPASTRSVASTRATRT